MTPSLSNFPSKMALDDFNFNEALIVGSAPTKSPGNAKSPVPFYAPSKSLDLTLTLAICAIFAAETGAVGVLDSRDTAYKILKFEFTYIFTVYFINAR